MNSRSQRAVTVVAVLSACMSVANASPPSPPVSPEQIVGETYRVEPAYYVECHVPNAEVDEVLHAVAEAVQLEYGRYDQVAFIDAPGGIIFLLLIAFGSAVTVFFWAKWMGIMIARPNRGEVIEDRVSGIEGVTKITSQSVDGRSSINLEFVPDRDVDEAANDVRDRVSRVAAQLPPEADPPEIGKVDFNAEPVIWLNLSSSTLDVLELTDYAERVIAERLGVLPGVARVRFGGARRYAMRVWIDREALAARQLTVTDIENALRRENVQLPAGRLESAQRELTLRTETGLNTEQDFRELVVGRGADGYLVRLREVADVRLAAENDRTLSRSNGVPGISIGVEQISKANTLEVASAVREEMERYAARRLQPFYIKSFFVHAFESLGGRLSEREPGLYRISHVPARVRNRAARTQGFRDHFQRALAMDEIDENELLSLFADLEAATRQPHAALMERING